MRYYQIRILNKQGQLLAPDPKSQLLVPNPGATATFTSHIGSQMIPGALNVELDIPAAPFAMPAGGAHVRVWGVGLPILSNASRLAYYTIEVLAGMKGDPDINRNAKAGQVLYGMIFQAYGNWTGVDQHLDLVVYPGATLPQLNAKIVFNWQAGQTLSDAIQQALESAFPSYTVNINISTIKQNHDEPATYGSVHAFAQQILEQTRGYFDSSYPGVQMTVSGNTIYVYDTANGASTEGNPLEIAFEDLIGQPTWIKPFDIAFQCPLRADIALGSWVRLPSGLYPPYVLATSHAAYPNAGPSVRSAFQGAFQIVQAHHYGNYRQADARSWNTTYWAAFPDKPHTEISGRDLTNPAGLV